MPELTIHVPPYMNWENCEWVQGITWQDIEMQLAWAELCGEPADSLRLNIGACDGGSTLEDFTSTTSYGRSACPFAPTLRATPPVGRALR